MQIHRKPFGQKHHLGWHRRTGGVGNLPQERQIKPGETVHRPRTARLGNGLRRPQERLALRAVTGEFQGEVGFDAGTHIDRSAGIDSPATAGQLLLEDAAGSPRHLRRGEFIRPGQDEDVFTFQNRVAFQRSAPVTIGVLVPSQPVCGEPHRIEHGRLPACHAEAITIAPPLSGIVPSCRGVQGSGGDRQSEAGRWGVLRFSIGRVNCGTGRSGGHTADPSSKPAGPTPASRPASPS